MNDIQVEGVSPAVLLDPFHPNVKAAAASGPISLLPEPQSLSDDDAIAGYLALESRSRSVSLNRAIRNIQSLRQEQRVEWEKQKAALVEAAKAQEDSGFWGSIGKVCGTIGKVAAVVTSIAVAAGTGGAALPLVLAVAGACLSTAALAQGEFNILQKMGVDGEASGWIGLGIALGGIACTGGAAFLNGAGSATQFAKIANIAEKASAAAAGGALITAGVATGKQASAKAHAEECYADAASARAHETGLDRLLLKILDDLEESEKSYRHTVGMAKSAIEIQDNALLISIGRN